MGKRKKKSGYWVYQCLTNNTNKWNAVLSLFKMLSLSISRFETRTRILFSKSRISRRERDFFINISEFETRPRYFFFKSHFSRWDFETRLTKFSREFSRSRNLAMLWSIAIQYPLQSKVFIKYKMVIIQCDNIQWVLSIVQYPLQYKIHCNVVMENPYEEFWNFCSHLLVSKN